MMLDRCYAVSVSFMLLLLSHEAAGFGVGLSSSFARTEATVQQRLYISMGSLDEDFMTTRRMGDSVSVSQVAATKERTSSIEDDEAWSAEVAKIVFANSTDPVLLFDGVCNLCNEAVNLCLDLDDNKIFRFASLQSKVGRALLIQNGRDPEDRSTMVLVKASKNKPATLELSCHTGSDAVLLIAAELQGLPRVLRWSARASKTLVPTFVREPVMKIIGKNRHLFGEADGPQCRLDLDGIYESRFLEDPDLQ